MHVSVIIPIFNAQRYLKNLFKCLDANEFELDDEIILVDNGSTDESKQICFEKASANPLLYKYYCFDEKPGSYAARNFAVSKAKGDILVFTDSDTSPDTNWIQNIRKDIKKGSILAGKIVLDVTENGIWEHFDKIAHLNSEANAKKGSVATANMAVLKDDFLMVGLFEERFSGGDYEWSNRAMKYGLKVKYLSKMIVHHPTRKTFEEILNKDQRVAYGAGNHYRLLGKKEIEIRIRYFLKIFKIDTNIRYTMKLRKRGFEFKKLCYFNYKFMIIRIMQYKNAIKGFRFLDVRKLGLK